MTERRFTRFDAVCLGGFQGGLIGGPPAALVLFSTDHMFLAAEMAAMAALSFYGWGKHFNYRWRLWDD